MDMGGKAPCTIITSNLIMNLSKSNILLFLFACSRCFGGWAQDFSSPFVLHNFEIKNGVNFLSWNMYEDSEYDGSIDAVSGLEITLPQPLYDTFIVNQFTTQPFLLVSRESGKEGTFSLIASNTEDSVFISDLNHDFEYSDDISIIPATRLKDIFFEVEDQIDPMDSVVIWTTFGWKNYRYINNQWYTAGTRKDQGDTIIYPDEGFIYIRSNSETFSFAQSGNANLSAKLSIPNKDKKWVLPNPFPVDVHLSELMDHFDLIKKPSLVTADKIAFWRDGASVYKIYYNDGNRWLDEGNQEIDPIIPSGKSFFILRSNESDAISQSTYIINPAYKNN